ncbi:hypothetical protein PNOK_0199700 [Pyrrhoderma noxium]|uniref:DUF6593 domain-containing protein n=1 Tax=Pyrrhoderma noxium TaxID=2282107 RepID=A0A286UR32_9AGAM|nr:hypothetical protein PNOK_0199700 [Pyrrhoderma noxium]
MKRFIQEAFNRLSHIIKPNCHVDKEYSEKAYSDSASVHSVEVPNDNVCLQLKTNSLRNNVLECDSLGFHYQVSTDISAPGRRATRSSFISKWISKTDEQIPLAEWKRTLTGKDTIKLSRELAPGGSSSSDFVPLQDFLNRQKLSAFLEGSEIFNRTFIGQNGKSYTWKSRSSSLKLHCDESDRLIAKFHAPHYVFNKRNGELELVSDWEEILDDIIVTFVMVEKLRREEARNSGST